MSRCPVAILALAAALALAGCLGSLNPAADGEPAPFDPGWPPLEEARIRPGVQVAGGACTSNFLFRSPLNRTLYLGTAAHCVPDRTRGDPVAVAGGEVTGSLAYSSFQAMPGGREQNPANDFALVELPDAARDRVHPALLREGGPTGLAGDVSPGDTVRAYGNSSSRPGEAASGPRRGVVTHHGPWFTGMYMVGPGIPGDSGSPVLTADGRALGVIVTLEVTPQPGSNNAANLDRLLAYANGEGGIAVELATWPLQDDTPLPRDPTAP